jgi:hypothetical protein
VRVDAVLTEQGAEPFDLFGELLVQAIDVRPGVRPLSVNRSNIVRRLVLLSRTWPPAQGTGQTEPARASQ